MSDHVLLNLLHELRKIDNKRGLPSIVSIFHKEFKESAVAQW